MRKTRFSLFLLAALLLVLVAQLGWAQAIAPDKSLAAKAVAANRASGKPVAVVPVATLATLPKPGARPLVWLARSLGKPATIPAAEPWFCNSVSGGFLFCPKGLQTAYGVKQIVGANGGAGMTIAIVDAYAYPNAEANLAQFNSDMGLPACTTGNGCFNSINLSPYDGSGSGWDLESMLDLEYAHAMAPNAKLVYVQSYDPSYDSFGVAEAIAASMADVVSNSWAGGEYPADDGYWNLGKPLLFASGDWEAFPLAGFVSYPCTALTVTCVGGTSLYVDANLQRTAETAWTGSGGGCSEVEPIPSWQQVFPGANVCSPYRAAPDFSAIADPNTGVAVYISNPYWTPGYYEVGGTSLATPVLAGLVADIDTARVSFGKAKLGVLNDPIYAAAVRNYPYFYFDVVSGSNGYPALPNFDLVTGLGVPKGPAMANRFFGLVYNPF